MVHWPERVPGNSERIEGNKRAYFSARNDVVIECIKYLTRLYKTTLEAAHY